MSTSSQSPPPSLVHGPPTLVIINERAGAGAMADAFRRFEHPLEDAIGPFDLAFTDAPGHATELARKALAGGDIGRIIVGGGDGTINEVVNGFFDPETGLPIKADAVLALLGGGTGGDFRKTVGTRTFEAAVSALRGGRTMPIDVGRMTLVGPESTGTVRHFINVAGFGFSGRVISALEGRGGTLFDRYVPTLKAIGGPIAYFGATLRALLDWNNVEIQLTVDGRDLPARRVASVAIGNGRYYGGGMMICPEARLDSGHFDVTVLGDLGKFEVIRLARTIYDGTHVRHPAVATMRATSLLASPRGPTPVLIELDGELSGALPARFDVIPSAIRLAIP